MIGVDDGSVSAPGLSFADDLDNGLYKLTTDSWAMAAAGAQVWGVTAAGAITKPLQPSFLITLGTQMANIAIDTETTIVWGNERYDVGGDFASNTFTAPVTGKYLFCVNIEANAIDSDADSYNVKLVASNRTMGAWILVPGGFDSDVNLYPIGFSTHMDMDASDTAYLTFTQTGGTQQTDLSTASYFSGSLLS